jgi:CO/xanthine dehydrogenase Mo-binding subunit
VVEVKLLADQTARVAGVGESGLPPAAPATANAVRALTGARLRELAMLPERVKAALKSRARSSFAPYRRATRP